MNLLTLNTDNKVVISPEALLIKEFNTIWKSDMSAKKERAQRELAYIYFSCDYNSLYRSYPPEKRERQIKFDLDMRVVSSNVIAAVKKYRELQSTPTLRFLESAIKAVEASAKYYNKVNYTKLDDNGNPKYKLGEVMKTLKDAASVAETLEKLHLKVQTEAQDAVRIRGGGTAGSFEDPPAKLTVSA